MAKYKNVMIDLETLGTRVTSVFVSIGACSFDIETGDIGDTFECNVDWTDALAVRTVDAKTLRWWFTQSGEARTAVLRAGQPLQECLDDLSQFIALGEYGMSDTLIWSHGASFDIAMLEHAYGGNPPWDYRKSRCCRTMLDMGRNFMWELEFERAGIYHNALHDAINQAKWVSQVYAGFYKMANLAE